MNRSFSPLICLFLTAVLAFGGAITHAGSVAHAHSNHHGATHQHVDLEEFKTAAASAQSDHFGPEIERETSKKDGAAVCLDAQCCTPAVHMPAQEFLRTLESDKLGPAAASDYALSVAQSLLKPPRALT